VIHHKLIYVGLCGVWLWQVATIAVVIPIPSYSITTESPDTEEAIAYEVVEPSGFSSLIFTGDIMLGRHVERLSYRHSSTYPFRGLSLPLLASDAAVIGNFEASIPQKHVPTPNYHLRFSVPAETLNEVKAAGFTHLSLANNHAYDFGLEGYDHTVKSMLAYDLTPFGHPYEIRDDSISYVPTPYGTIALIGINQTFHSIEKDELLAIMATAEIGSVKQIVYIHWGDEYKLKHSPAQSALATQLVDAGADLVIGHHPHVVQDIGSINGVPIVYSLGNYIFDQYFSYDVQVGLVVALELGESSSTLKLHPITSIGSQSQPQLKSEFERQAFLNSLAERSSEEVRASIQVGSIPLSWQFASSTKTAMISQ